MRVERLDDGLWRWTLPHPAWVEGDDWGREVGCVYWEGDGAIVLVDPLVPTDAADEARFFEALDRDVARRRLPVVSFVTCAWHGRSAMELAARYGGRAMASWRSVELEGIERFALGDRLPGGVVAIDAGAGAEEVVYWLAGARAVVPGDSLIGDGEGGVRLCPASWLDGPGDLEGVAAGLALLLELPVERVLVSHGDPVRSGGLEALRRALSPYLAA